MPGLLALQTQNTIGVNETAVYIDSAQLTGFLGIVKKGTFSVDTSTGNVTLVKSQLRGNWLFTNPSGATRTVTLPAPSISLSGASLYVFNISVSQSLIVSYTGGGAVKTLTAGQYAEFGCEGTAWFELV
jgi:hypothetical protein